MGSTYFVERFKLWDLGVGLLLHKFLWEFQTPKLRWVFSDSTYIVERLKLLVLQKFEFEF